MEFIKKNINFIILGIIIILLIIIGYLYFTKEKEFIKTFKNNGIQTVKIYTNKNADKIFSKIEKESNSAKIEKTLKELGIEKFIINNNGIITAGKHYAESKYLVSIIKDDKVTDIVRLESETLYISEEEDVLVGAIDKDVEKAKKISKKCLETKKLDKNEAVYIVDGNDKKMTDKFKKYLK